MNPDQIWQAALGELQLQLSRATYDTWLREAEYLGYENGTFVVTVPTIYIKNWIDGRMLSTVNRTLTGIVGQTAEARFIVAGNEAEPEEADERVEVTVQQFDWLRTPFIRSARYFEKFWRPRLGLEAYAVWRYIRTMNFSMEAWSRDLVINLDLAQATLGIGRVQMIGREVIGDEGSELGGILGLLKRLNLGEFVVIRHHRNCVVRGRVRNTLPVLLPKETESLPPELQQEHYEWLWNAAGFRHDDWLGLDKLGVESLNVIDPKNKRLYNRVRPYVEVDWYPESRAEAYRMGGWIDTPVYEERFWQALVGIHGWALYLWARSEFWAPDENGLSDPIERPIKVLARLLGCGPQQLAGVARPIEHMNGNRRGLRRQPGGIELLERAGAAQVTTEGEFNSRKYRIRIYVQLPPLDEPRHLSFLPAGRQPDADEAKKKRRRDKAHDLLIREHTRFVTTAEARRRPRPMG